MLEANGIDRVKRASEVLARVMAKRDRAMKELAKKGTKVKGLKLGGMGSGAAAAAAEVEEQKRKKRRKKSRKGGGGGGSRGGSGRGPGGLPTIGEDEEDHLHTSTDMVGAAAGRALRRPLRRAPMVDPLTRRLGT